MRWTYLLIILFFAGSLLSASGRSESDSDGEEESSQEAEEECNEECDEEEEEDDGDDSLPTLEDIFCNLDPAVSAQISRFLVCFVSLCHRVKDGEADFWYEEELDKRVASLVYVGVAQDLLEQMNFFIYKGILKQSLEDVTKAWAVHPKVVRYWPVDWPSGQVFMEVVAGWCNHNLA